MFVGETGRWQYKGSRLWGESEGPPLREAVGDQGKGRNQCYRYGTDWDYKDYLTSTISTEYVGPFSDSIRLMDNPEARQMVQPSAGIHIILPGYYSPRSMGLLDPATSDGRVIFFLPWLGEKDACLVCSKLNLYVVCR